MMISHIDVPIEGRSVKVWLLLKRLSKRRILGERAKARRARGWVEGQTKHFKRRK